MANAPSASPKVGHNGTLKNENIDIVNGSSEQCKNNISRNNLFKKFYCDLGNLVINDSYGNI